MRTINKSTTTSRGLSAPCILIAVGHPPELRKAYRENDKAVMCAYGFDGGRPARKSESQCVAELMKLYQKPARKF